MQGHGSGTRRLKGCPVCLCVCLVIYLAACPAPGVAVSVSQVSFARCGGTQREIQREFHRPRTWSIVNLFCENYGGFRVCFCFAFHCENMRVSTCACAALCHWEIIVPAWEMPDPGSSCCSSLMDAVQGEEELEPDFPPSPPFSPASTVIAHLQSRLALALCFWSESLPNKSCVETWLNKLALFHKMSLPISLLGCPTPPSSSKETLDPIVPVALAWKQEATQRIGYRPCSQFLSVMGPASFYWPCLYCQRSLQLKLTLEQRLPGCPVSLCARSHCRSALETVMCVAHRCPWALPGAVFAWWAQPHKSLWPFPSHRRTST